MSLLAAPSPGTFNLHQSLLRFVLFAVTVPLCGRCAAPTPHGLDYLGSCAGYFRARENDTVTSLADLFGMRANDLLEVNPQVGGRAGGWTDG